MDTYCKVLSIAGSDCSGGAGIQADIKTCSAIGVYAMTVITSVTAQNTIGITGIMDISPEMVARQLDAIFSDISPDAVKIGMLSSKAIIETVAERLSRYSPRHIILDPVMISTSGHKLIDDSAIDSLMSQLLPIATLVTPNRHEAELLSSQTIDSRSDICNAAYKILKMGAKAVLIKGGHFNDADMTDYLFNQSSDKPVEYKAHIINSPNTHGTGCTYSSAIASYLALGLDLNCAISKAKKYLTYALAAGADKCIGHGHGPVNHFYAPSPLKIHQL